MSHWRHMMVDGAEIWITCQLLRILKKASHWWLIQNLVPSTTWTCGRQCNIRIEVWTLIKAFRSLQNLASKNTTTFTIFVWYWNSIWKTMFDLLCSFQTSYESILQKLIEKPYFRSKLSITSWRSWNWATFLPRMRFKSALVLSASMP